MRIVANEPGAFAVLGDVRESTAMDGFCYLHLRRENPGRRKSVAKLAEEQFGNAHGDPGGTNTNFSNS